jgi:hypothetical protein
MIFHKKIYLILIIILIVISYHSSFAFYGNLNCLNLTYYIDFLNNFKLKLECADTIIDPNVKEIRNCESWMRYLANNGESPSIWCSKEENYQKCCITCQRKSTNLTKLQQQENKS